MFKILLLPFYILQTIFYFIMTCLSFIIRPSKMFSYKNINKDNNPYHLTKEEKKIAKEEMLEDEEYIETEERDDDYLDTDED